MFLKKLSPPECGDHKSGLPVNLGRAEKLEEYSGFIIIRLSSRLAFIEGESLEEIARKLNLRGILSIFKQFDIGDAKRVVKSRSQKEILRLEKMAVQTDLPPIHSLTSYWRIDMRCRPERIEEAIKRLNDLDEVDFAYKEMAVSEPAINDSDDPYAGGQDYLDPAPIGIDARWVWTQLNGEGAGVGVVDLEQGWFLGHEDLVSKAPTIIYGDNRDGVGSYKGNHGTAVLGEIAADDNTVGVVGIAPSVSSVRVASHYDSATNTNLHVADAIVASVPVMAPGDVLLLEVQRSYMPTETDDADFDAIRLAVALGIIVIEAAGNGNADLDAYTDGVGNAILNRADATFRESGAIMVGSSVSTVPHNRYVGCGVGCGSNFGSRIDCYGWGQNITTCGYGDLDPGTGDNSTYTDAFGGTSGASPMITGAALLLQGMYNATTGGRLSPGQMRTLLSNSATGTPQGSGVAGYISVMPDLRAIIEDVLGIVPDVYIRDNIGDTGAVPSTGSISTSPDVIVLPDTVANPVASFGEGSGTENSTTLGYKVVANHDHFIYIRMKNRGTGDANDVTATVYWSEVATLVTPDMWNLIGTTLPVNVPQGDTLVVAGPLTWDHDDIPGEGHYCFVSLLDHPQDPAPPIPPGPPIFDWDSFRSFIRNYNNVTWRNFNVIDDVLDPLDPIALPFLIKGTPDLKRIFEIQVLQKLPEGAEVSLEVPLSLGLGMVKGRLLKYEIDRRKKVMRIRLPSQPRFSFCRVTMAAGGRYQSRLIVKSTRSMENGGNSVAIRQLFEGEEVGRVTWQFISRKTGKKAD